MTVMGRLRRIPSWQITLGLALLGLGFLIAAQLASEGPRVRYTTQERPPLLATATELQARQEDLKAQILELRARITELEGSTSGSAAIVKELNDELEQARLAAGLIPLTGTGIVLQVEDSQQPVADGDSADDYLVSARDIRTVVDELWLAGAEAVAVNGERMTPTSAVIDIGSTVLVNSAYLVAPYRITAIGPKDLYARLSAAPGFMDFVRARAQRYGIRIVVRGAGVGRYAGLRGDRLAALLAADRLARAGALDHPRGQSRRLTTMHVRRNQLTIAAVAFVLGLLVVVQLRAQAGTTGLEQLSTQDLTVLVANLNDRNDQLRNEVATLAGEAAALSSGQTRGAQSVDQIRMDLRRVRAYAGLDPVTGPGVTITISGPIDGPGARGARQRAAQCRRRGDRRGRRPAGAGGGDGRGRRGRLRRRRGDRATRSTSRPSVHPSS